MLAFLVDVFERSWERGRLFTNRETSLMKDIAAEQRAMTMRMLIEGHSDPVSAKRLGVSPRTYAGYVADLKADYDAQTRFQLGYTMGRMGVSGQEDDRGRSGGVSPARDLSPRRRLPRAFRVRPRKCHEGSDLAVTALVLLRRAWGVGARTRQVGGSRVLVSSLRWWNQPRPLGVAALDRRRVVVRMGRYGGGADQAGGQCHGADDYGDPAHEVLHCFPTLLVYGGPTEWPASGSL